MQKTYAMKTMVVGIIAGLLLTGGCQPWEKKYAVCNANLENLQGLFELCQDELAGRDATEEQLSLQLAAMQNALKNSQTQLKQKETFDPGFAGENASFDAQRGTVTVPLSTEVLFDAGKVTLKSSSKSRLKKIADEINAKHAGKAIYVVGHTDTDPIKKSGWKDNWQLSAERALAVTRYLIDQKVPAKHLAVVGRGEFHPIGKSKAASRRVEIVVDLY